LEARTLISENGKLIIFLPGGSVKLPCIKPRVPSLALTSRQFPML
jgi:hypothetical protein